MGRAVGFLVLVALIIWGFRLVDAQDDTILKKPSQRLRPQTPVMERAEEPKPPPIDGWIIVEVCSVTGKLDHPFSEWAYIRPEVIVAITNPVSTPENCVAISSSGNRRIYIKGSLDGIAALVTERMK